MAATLHLFDHFRRHVRALKAGRPGHRFLDRYERMRGTARQSGALERIVMFVAALICLAIGVVLSVIPGPAIPFFFLAGGLLAAESRGIARLMDWIEVRGRRLVAWGKRRWRQMPTWARIVAIIIGVACSAGAAFLSCRLFLA